MGMSVGPCRRLEPPIRRLAEPAETHEGHGSCPKHAEQHRIARAQVPRVVGRGNRRRRIADLRSDECERVVAERKIWAQLDGMLELKETRVVTAAKPERAAHRPMGGRIPVVGYEALSGPFQRPIDCRMAFGPSLECVLEVS